MKLKHLHYGWVMVIIGTCILAAYATTTYTFGIFLRPLTEEFNWDRGALSGAYSIFWLVNGSLSILTGRISDKYGPRLLLTISGLFIGVGFLLMSQVSSLWQVYLNWGVILAVGGGCCFVPITAAIPRWFTKRRGMAVGITVTGFGIGGLIGPTLAQWLISSYSWQQAFIILGLITFIIIVPLAQFTKQSPQRSGLRPYGEDETVEEEESLASTEEGSSFKQVIKTSRFWIFGAILFCFFFCLQVVVVHVPPYAVDIGISAMIAASIVSIIAMISIIGRFSVGFISDRVGGRRVLTACVVMATLALIWLLFAREIWMFYTFAVAFGLAYGGMAPLMAIITAELFGLGSLGIIFGCINFLGLVGGAAGPFLAGSIFDIRGGYSLAFLICIGLDVLAIVLSLILLKAKGWGGD